MEFENNAYFWQKIDTLFLSSDLTITQPKNSTHPVYNNLIYPVDYGYLSETAGDMKISVFSGSEYSGVVQAIVVCVDILKKDMDVKLLTGCTAKEQRNILEFLNQTDFQKTVILKRGQDIPDWATKD